MGCKSAPIDSFQQRLEQYIQENYSTGYYCDILPDHKYFFDIVSVPYKNTGEYLVSFDLWWYALEASGTLTDCGWAQWAGLIVRDEGDAISLVYKFADFPELETRKDDVLLLPKNTVYTTYDQAKRYFLK